ncbi:ATP-binding protein [Roseateles sp. BYS180W]|uniref:histidine kinase n=1 Tax=Roseateles rivi TaxID=3299028 RepID=A0ABW7FSW9_9BURK
MQHASPDHALLQEQAQTAPKALRSGAARLWPWLRDVTLTVLLVAGGAITASQWRERVGLNNLAAVATERLELYAANLEAELGRHAYLPSLLAADTHVQQFLSQPQDASARQRLSSYLAGVNVRAGTMQILLTDAQGQVLAASDQRPPAAQLREALASDALQFFVGSEQEGPSFYLLHPMQREGQTRAVVVVKLSLAPLEASWMDLGLRTQGERLLVADAHGVVVMSSFEPWRHRLLEPRRADKALPGFDEARYARPPGPALGLPTPLQSHNGVSLVMLRDQPDAAPRRHMAQERLLVPQGLRMLSLSQPTEVWEQARLAGWAGAAMGLCVALLWLYLVRRRRHLHQLFSAQVQLQQAHAQLERVVDHRTAELRQTNAELKRQIQQRLQTEGELLQAGKLAVLGQMSAGLSHEVNQPLTALRALAGNSLRLLQAGRHAEVADNLHHIDQMVQRMGAIARQLKSFARRAEPLLGPVSLLDCVRHAELILQHRLRALELQLQLDIAPGLRVRAEGNRLEQVLVNLLGNALDALADAPQRELRVRALRQDGQRVLVAVQDSGCGLSDAQLQRLFEPFFTTKPAGEGLGLGLVISSKIVHEFGGTLRAQRLPTGMSFEFDLAVETWHAAEDEDDV